MVLGRSIAVEDSRDLAREIKDVKEETIILKKLKAAHDEFILAFRESKGFNLSAGDLQQVITLLEQGIGNFEAARAINHVIIKDHVIDLKRDREELKQLFHLRNSASGKELIDINREIGSHKRIGTLYSHMQRLDHESIWKYGEDCIEIIKGAIEAHNGDAIHSVRRTIQLAATQAGTLFNLIHGVEVMELSAERIIINDTNISRFDAHLQTLG